MTIEFRDAFKSTSDPINMVFRFRSKSLKEDLYLDFEFKGGEWTVYCCVSCSMKCSRYPYGIFTEQHSAYINADDFPQYWAEYMKHWEWEEEQALPIKSIT